MITGNPIAAAPEPLHRQYANIDLHDRPEKEGEQRTDRLRDGECRPKPNKLHGREQKDPRLAYSMKRLVGWGVGFVGEEVKQFSGDAVSEEGVAAHVPAMSRRKYERLHDKKRRSGGHTRVLQGRLYFIQSDKRSRTQGKRR